MKHTIAVIGQMEADGIVARYAIGGAVASFLYVDVAFTEDLDILVALHAEAVTSAQIMPGAITEYLAENGFAEFRKEGIRIHGWPVQFLPVADFWTMKPCRRASSSSFQSTAERRSVAGCRGQNTSWRRR